MPESWIASVLEDARAQCLERAIDTYPQTGGQIVVNGRTLLNLSSNDYLGLAHHPSVVAASRAALNQYGAGATASRLVTGSLTLHSELEHTLAGHKGYPACLLFGSGYMTNLGTITSLVGKDDEVFADRWIHASMIDAATLSRARLHRFHHNDPGHLETLLRRPARGRRLVLVESCYSMDGDLAPLPDIAAVARAHKAMLMVDEAHASGVFGPGGSGLIVEHGLQDGVNVAMGTLSKALGSYGGYVCTSEAMKRLLIQKARAFVYTTAPAPAVIGAALGALAVLSSDSSLGPSLLARASRFRSRLNEAGFDTLKSRSQIIPLLVGENALALEMAGRLREKGVLAVAIRPPTVPRNAARLRLSVTLAHSDAELDRAAHIIIDIGKEMGILR